jgi:MoaA/NifB/PqqE/SkfB family radical SAM enzyme
MKRVDIKVGFVCNNHCRFCVQGNKREFFPNRNTEEIKHILRDCCLESAEGVVFTGGEPTIREDIVELVKYAKSLGFKIIQIQTNGRMFSYMDFCKKMIDAGATEFSPAIHGPNEKIHDFLTSVKGSFKETIKGIENLEKIRQFVLTNTVITSYNYRYLPNIAKLLVDLGVDQFQFAFVHIVGTAAINADWIVPRKREIMFYIKKGLDIGIKAGIRVMTEAIPYCFMIGYEDFVAERFIPNTKVYDYDLLVEDFNKLRIKEGKIKGPSCHLCKNNNFCEGPWKEYPELFGWNEFIPTT